MPKTPIIKDGFVRRFRREAARWLPPGSRLVVAVSGGADSLALFHLLVQSNLVDLTNLLVAHFDHGLRASSTEDARFVESVAQTFGVAFTEGRWSQQTTAGNLAENARDARYRFLLNSSHHFRANLVATGHHQNDQAETFLERLLRGSGVTGLKAMPFCRPLSPEVGLLRPLLSFNRRDIEQWLTSRNLFWREDPSNLNMTRMRPRLRHTVLPILEDVTPKATSHIAAAASRLARADEALSWMLDRYWPQLNIQPIHAGMTLSHSALVFLPDELQCQILRRCHQIITGITHPPGSRAIENFLKMIHFRRQHWQMRIHGLEVRREAEQLFLCKTSLSPRREQGNG